MFKGFAIRALTNAINPMNQQVIDIKYDLVKWLGSKIHKREGIVLGMDLLVRLTAGFLGVIHLNLWCFRKRWFKNLTLVCS